MTDMSELFEETQGKTISNYTRVPSSVSPGHISVNHS